MSLPVVEPSPIGTHPCLGGTRRRRSDFLCVAPTARLLKLASQFFRLGSNRLRGRELSKRELQESKANAQHRAIRLRGLVFIKCDNRPRLHDTNEMLAPRHGLDLDGDLRRFKPQQFAKTPVNLQVTSETASRSNVARRPLKKQANASYLLLDNLPDDARIVWRRVLALPPHGRGMTRIMHNGCDRVFVQVVEANNAHRGIDGTVPVPPDHHLAVRHSKPSIDIDFALTRARRTAHGLQVLLRLPHGASDPL